MAKSFDEQIREAFKKSGKSLSGLARETGLDKGPLQRFVSGQQSLRLDSAEKLCCCLGVNLVVGGVKKKKKTAKKAKRK